VKRYEDWKLILFLTGLLSGAVDRVGEAIGELYDLKNTPYEWKDFYTNERYDAIRERMKTDLLMRLMTAWAHGSEIGGLPISAS
jgi:hypothetical protein